jgi:hypothetical protein
MREPPMDRRPTAENPFEQVCAAGQIGLDQPLQRGKGGRSPYLSPSLSPG